MVVVVVVVGGLSTEVEWERGLMGATYIRGEAVVGSGVVVVDKLGAVLVAGEVEEEEEEGG